MNVMVDMEASPERMGTKDQFRFSPNGTRVPNGPPPKSDDDDDDDDDVSKPRVPSFPLVAGELHGGDDQTASLVRSLYDTCESNPMVKNGDLPWKP